MHNPNDATPVDAQAFEGIYAAHHAAVMAYCARRVPHADAVDATAEVFATAWRRRRDIPNDEATLPWLYGVARNVVGHSRRSFSRRTRLGLRLQGLSSAPPPEPSVRLVQRTEYEQVLMAAAELRESDQEILRLAVWEELPYAQISAVLGVSETAARKRLQRATERLARQYRRMGFDLDDRPSSTVARKEADDD